MSASEPPVCPACGTNDRIIVSHDNAFCDRCRGWLSSLAGGAATTGSPVAPAVEGEPARRKKKKKKEATREE